MNKFGKELYLIKNDVFSNFQKIIYFDEPFYSLTVFIELYLLWKMSKIVNDKLIILVIGNVLLFYSFLEEKYPRFLFRCRMFIKEIIEGILGIFLALIPKYEDNKNIKQKLL